MLVANSSRGRGIRLSGVPITTTFIGNSGVHLTHSRLSLRNHLKYKGNLLNYADSLNSTRMKRLKTKKINGVQKMDLSKKKTVDYTEMAYREAVSKLKYLLAESYPKSITGKSQGIRSLYQSSNTGINELEEIDDRSMISDSSKVKDLAGNTRACGNSYFPSSKNIHPLKTYSNLVLSNADLQSVPPEVTSFIERQEEYIEQLERESQFCRDELTNLLRKVREKLSIGRQVVAENEALHNRSRSGFLKYAFEEHKDGYNNDCNKHNSTQTETHGIQKYKMLEGPSIVFESRISELEAQLTQAKLELRKVQEENEVNLKKMSESCLNSGGPELKIQLEQALRAKYEAEAKLEDLQKSLSIVRDKQAEASQKAKQSTDTIQQIEFEKNQCETEIRRLKNELDKQHEKLREATQEANRRIADERQQAERRYSQQVEQLSADIASHWDAANKSQLESEKQRRELMELRRELSQKQTFIDNLKKELQNKISNLQSELNQAMTEKDAVEQEVLATKLATERNERQSRQEQNRLQAEINSYKQRLERADADLVHCRRENLRLSEQIASLEKEISMNKAIHPENPSSQTLSKLDNDKELTSMIMDMETKHAATVAGLEEALNNQATLVSRLTAECQSLTQRLEANNLKYKEEMASLQSGIEYLSNKIHGSFDNDKEMVPVEGKDESCVMYNCSTSGNPSLQAHENTAPQIVDEERNIMMNERSAEKYSSSNHEEYDNKDKLNNDSKQTTEEYEQQNESQNIEENYITDNQNSQPYVTEQQYPEYEQCKPTSYGDEEYVDGNHYNLKEAHNESQYYGETQENNPDAAQSSTEFSH